MNNVQRTINNGQRVVSVLPRKARAKKTSFLGAIFQLLIATCYLLICIACENIFEVPKTGRAKTAGKGYFSLTLEGQGTGRTIMPTTKQDDFAWYTLKFVDSSLSEDGLSANTTITVERTNANLSEPILLDTGIWNLSITAYVDDEKTKPAAQGEKTEIVISAEETATGNLILMPIVDGLGMGIFKWNIGYPSNVTEAAMTITRLSLSPETELDAQTISFTGAAPQIGSVELPTGYYRVVFKLKPEDDLETERRETLHIYQNMESFFPIIFEDSHFNSPLEINVEDFEPGAIISGLFNVSTTEDWNDTITAITDGGDYKNYIINISGNVPVAGRTGNTFDARGIIVSLRGEGGTLALYDNGEILRIGSDQTVILRDLTLKGHSSNTASLVHVDGGVLEMNGGEISYNTANSGGGVNVGNYGIFTLSGDAVISGNEAKWGGGVNVGSYGTFNMIGGTISNNEVKGDSDSSGGGVNVGENGTFNMSGGNISYNNTSKTGGGVNVWQGNFTMRGGNINGNTSSDNGGGVQVTSANATFTMVNGEIFNNQAASGGGVHVWGATFIMEDGSISNNNSTGYGGGVFVGGTFTMNGGKIFGNTSHTNGGGMYVGSPSAPGTCIFHISTGTIYGSNAEEGLKNTASSGAALYRYSGTVEYGKDNSWTGLSTTNNTIRVVNGVSQ